MWARAVKQWRGYNAHHEHKVDGEQAPSAEEQYLLYQTLLGAWPLELLPGGDAAAGEGFDYQNFVGRIQDYMEKAIHEAKVKSSWIEPNQAWDKANREFVAAILERKKDNRFLDSFLPLAQRVAELGMVNSLSQIVLKCTVPGVPDFYQGNELWDLSLVDPDNRRPVDYGHRQQLLESLRGGADPAELVRSWQDGRIKLFVTQRLLKLRQARPELFQHGPYAPAIIRGEFGACCITFTREWEGKRLLVIVPRLTGRIGFPPLGERWRDTRVEAPGAWRNIFTGMEHDHGRLALSTVLAEFPVAVFVER